MIILPALCLLQTRSLTIIEAARRQVGVTVTYDPSYQRLAFPGGDVPADRGVCTDVVIRALRVARRIDLQRLVNTDMSVHFTKYPTTWGRKKPDPNIDHRRVPNLQVFFRRKGWEVAKGAPDLPGDLITVMLPRNKPHIMVVSDRRSPRGKYLAIHNIGLGAREEDVLDVYPVTGHYRVR